MHGIPYHEALWYLSPIHIVSKAHFCSAISRFDWNGDAEYDLKVFVLPLSSHFEVLYFVDNFVELWTLLNWAEPGCLGSLDHVREK